MSYQLFPEMAVELIKEKGIAGLGGFDGCHCSRFSVFGFMVNVSCRKSLGTGEFNGSRVRVSSRCLDIQKDDLKRVGGGVCDDLGADHYHSETPIQLIVDKEGKETIFDMSPVGAI